LKAAPLVYLCAIGLLSTTHSWRHDTDHQRLVLCAVILVLVLLASGLISLVRKQARTGRKPQKRSPAWAIVPAGKQKR